MEICLKCNKAYITKKGGIVVNELAGFGSYKLWAADLKECPECHHQIIAGFAKDSYSEHYMKRHKESLEKSKKLGILFEWKQ